MGHRLLIRLLVCIFVAALLLYSYIDKLNGITQLQIEIPKLVAEVKVLQEENNLLSLEIEKIENPKVLLEKIRQPEYSHLKQPSSTSVIFIEEG